MRNHSKVAYLVFFTSFSEKLPITVLRNIYFAFIYPHLIYGIELYGNTYHTYLDKLLKLNNKLLKNFKAKTNAAMLNSFIYIIILCWYCNCMNFMSYYLCKTNYHKITLPSIFTITILWIQIYINIQLGKLIMNISRPTNHMKIMVSVVCSIKDPYYGTIYRIC